MIKRVDYEEDILINECDKLLSNLIIEDSKYDNNYNVNFKLNSFKEDLKNINNYLYVYLDNNEIVGFIFGKVISSKKYKNNIGKVLFLYVSEKYRNKKVGTKLMNEIKNIFSENGVKYIELNVFKDNKKANNFYKKLSFYNYVETLRCNL